MLSLRCVLKGVLAAATLFSAIASAHADDAAALKDRLHAAEKDTSLTGDDAQPFYLKLSVQLFDPKGAPSEQGTVELYWAGAHKENRVYSFPSYSATEVRVDGKVFRTAGSGVPPAMASLLIQQVLHPMAQVSEIDKSDPRMQKVTLGKMQLDCIMVRPTGVAPSSLGLFPTYCLDPGDGALRASTFGGQIVLRNMISVFKQRHIALDVVITARGVQAAEGKIEKMEGRDIADSDLSTDGLVVAPPAPVHVSSGVIAGMALTHPAPEFPAMARARHIQGTVVLHALIGKDGHIQHLEVVSSPDQDLSNAAKDAVNRWTYRPYLLSGEPVEVDTTIYVNFAFGGR